MRSILLLFSIFALFAVSFGYVSRITYYSSGDLTPGQETLGADQNSNVRGVFLISYDASSSSFRYRVISNALVVGAVTLNGPSRCWNKPQGFEWSWGDANCIRNSAPKIFDLGKGTTPSSTKPDVKSTFQYFEGTLGFNNVHEAMFFDGELYISLNTQILGPDGKWTDSPLLRGRVRVYDHRESAIASYLIFNGQGGQYGAQNVGTSNMGFGILYQRIQTNTDFSVKIYTTIADTGSIILKCASGSKELGNANPLNTGVNFETGEKPLLTEIYVPKQCYVFITSSAYNSGELFSGISNFGSFEVLATRAKVPQKTETMSPSFAFFVMTFDTSHKFLDIVTIHNMTLPPTSVDVLVTSTNPPTSICQLMVTNNNVNSIPSRSFCYVNSTSLEDLNNGKLAVVVKNANFQEGEVYGNVARNGEGSLLEGGSGNSSLALGLGLGLGLGIPLCILAILGVLYYTKQHGNGKI